MNEALAQDIYTCKVCQKKYGSKELRKKKFICDSCGYHFRISAMDRISMVTDKGSFEEWEEELETENYLEDDIYDETLKRAKEKTGLKEAIIVGCCIRRKDRHWSM